MRFRSHIWIATIALAGAVSCKPRGEEASATQASAASAGQAAIADGSSPKSIARIALDSKDHTTLVAASRRQACLTRWPMPDH